VAAKIKAKHPKVPEVRTFMLDFATEGLAAGVEALKEVGEELMRSLIRINVEDCFIVNIGSASASVIPSDPMYSVYATTKVSSSSSCSQITALLRFHC